MRCRVTQVTFLNLFPSKTNKVCWEWRWNKTSVSQTRANPPFELIISTTFVRYLKWSNYQHVHCVSCYMVNREIQIILISSTHTHTSKYEHTNTLEHTEISSKWLQQNLSWATIRIVSSIFVFFLSRPFCLDLEIIFHRGYDFIQFQWVAHRKLNSLTYCKYCVAY